MPVVYCEPVWESDGGSLNAQAVREYELVVDVRTDDVTLGLASVALDAAENWDAPWLGSPHYDDAGALCTEISGSRLDDHPEFWQLTYHYSSDLNNAEGQDPTQPTQDPIERSPIWTYGWEVYSEFVWEDADGNALVNAAGDPLEPYEVKKAYLRATASYFVDPEDYDPLDEAALAWAVNDDTWEGIPAQRALMVGHDAAQQYVNGMPVVHISRTILIHPTQWKTRILNQGRRARPAVDTPSEPVIDPVTGVIVNDPVLLDADGIKTDMPNFLDFFFSPQETFPVIPV